MISIEQKKLFTDIIQAIHSIDEHLEGRRVFDEYRWNVIMKYVPLLKTEVETLLEDRQ